MADGSALCRLRETGERAGKGAASRSEARAEPPGRAAGSGAGSTRGEAFFLSTARPPASWLSRLGGEAAGES